MDIEQKEQFNQDLLAWYDTDARVLPWRSDPQPYQVWVSEIMLQQTRVEAVKGYFDRFITALPNIHALAEVDDDYLHKLWEGLGYYNRVRNMKKCAQVCVEEYQGILPGTYEELLALPGIGEYTAGAIASIAFGERVPAVDGNVLRVFSRLTLSYDDILLPKTKQKFQMVIQAMMPENARDFNQAVMEIGAMICVPNAAPRCNICPLSKHCHGYQEGKAHFLPVKTPKKKRKLLDKTIFVMIHHHQIGIRQRPDDGLLASLYEFLSVDEKLTKKEAESLCMEQGYQISNMVRLPKAKHIFTHLEWHMQGYLCICDTVPNQVPLQYVTLQEIEHIYAMPTALKVYREAAIQWLRSEGQE